MTRPGNLSTFCEVTLSTGLHTNNVEAKLTYSINILYNILELWMCLEPLE